MAKRLPPAREVSLSHRNIFISPTAAGFSYLLLCLVLLLVAINFQNSAVYALTFSLLAVFIASIFHTFRNLAGLVARSEPTEPVFAGNEALFHTTFSTTARSRHFSLLLSWQNKQSAYFDVEPDKSIEVSLRYQVGPRGLCMPGRLKVETRYPFGLLSARTYIDLTHQVVVYPFPKDLSNNTQGKIDNFDSGQVEVLGSDDFFSLRDYQRGDSVKNIAWRSYAKSDKLVVKQFIDYFDYRRCFNWDDMQGNTEDRLSQMAFWVIEAENLGERYAVEMPGVSIKSDSGKAHLVRALEAFALFGKDVCVKDVSSEPSRGDSDAQGEAANQTDTFRPKVVEQ